jgi:signal transduction histidine kinase
MEDRGHSTRLAAARIVIIAVTALVGASVVLALGLIITRAMTIPGYRPRAWYNTLLSAGMFVSGLLALRWIRISVERGVVFFALFCIATLAMMAVLDYQNYVLELGRDRDFSVSFYAPHLGILAVALVAGTRPALVTAAGGVVHLLLLSRCIPHPLEVGTPIIIALVLPLTALLVERLLDEVENEARRARLAETSIDIMTHDLGNPLTVLSASLDLLEEQKDFPDQREILMRAIRRSTRTLRHLLDEFRDVPHMDQVAPMEMVDLTGIVHDVIELYARPMCKRRGLTLHADLQSVEVVGAPSRLGRMTRELLTNAMKYSLTVGRIEVTLHAEEQAILRVSDNGSGISEEELPHVFEQHWRGSAAAQKSVSGRGLGLFICKKIVGNHGGRIKVESRKGQGSTFTVYLPLPGSAVESSSLDMGLAKQKPDQP